jgi:diguanylate cyclase (GGDEF)-like protein
VKAPDIPENEAERLKTLRSQNILNTPMEERFDRITRMARRLFNVPIALVSLIDEDRQWFKSCMGLSVRETPRDISFCGHTILDDKIFVVADAKNDQRFVDNPLVLSEPNIGFYAGCPLRAHDGQMLGTLCLIDTQARTFGDEDQEMLRDLALIVEAEIACAELNTVDELTNISNRRGFLMLAEHALNMCARRDLPASLVMIDIDQFKAINDAFGRREGDRALRSFSEQMKSTLRSSDVFARIGSDEFVVLLSNTSSEMAAKVMSSFNKILSEFNARVNRGYNLAFSYGVVEFNANKHSTVEKVLIDADIIMYDQKKQKRYSERQAAKI